MINNDRGITLITVLGSGPVSYHLLHGPESSFHFLQFFFFSKVRGCFVVITPRLWAMFPASQQSLPKCKKSRRAVKEERELKMTVAGLDLSYGAGVRTLRREWMELAAQLPGRPPVFMWSGSWFRALLQCTYQPQCLKFSTLVAPCRNSMCEGPPDQPDVSIRIAWRTPPPNQLCS